MNVSRSETHQQDKLRRQAKRKKTLRLQLLLLGLILVAGGGLLIVTQQDWIADRLGGKSQNQTSGLQPSEGKDQTGEDTGNSGLPTGANEQEESQPNSDEPGGSGEEQPGMEADAGEEAGGARGTDETAGNTEEGSPDRVELTFVGDVLINEYVSSVTELEGYDYLFQKALFHLSESDLTAGNLEYPVTTRGVPVKGTPYVFKGSPETLPSIVNAGFDIMSLANNHALDQGIEGLRDTMQHLDDAGLAYVGAGNNDTEAYAPVIKEVRGIKIAYVGVSKVIPFTEWKADKNVAGVAESYDIRRATQAIAKAKEQADVVVVLVHWGEERVDRPVSYQFEYAKAYVDAGADLVVGSHPHVLQGFEQYKGKWIAYSLGNFIFSTNPKDAGAETGVLDASCTKDGACELQFYPMATVRAQPTPLEGEAAKALLDRLSSISYGVKLEDDGRLAAD